MIMNTVSKVIAAVLLASSISSCKKQTCDEPAPQLSFDTMYYKVTTEADSLYIVTQFSDCQGDIANEDNSYLDIHTYLYEQIGGQWVKFLSTDSNDKAFFSKIPYTTKVNEGVELIGKVEQRIGAARQNSDTVRFEVSILDRAGHESNVVTTPTFVYPN